MYDKSTECQECIYNRVCTTDKEEPYCLFRDNPRYSYTVVGEIKELSEYLKNFKNVTVVHDTDFLSFNIFSDEYYSVKIREVGRFKYRMTVCKLNKATHNFIQQESKVILSVKELKERIEYIINKD